MGNLYKFLYRRPICEDDEIPGTAADNTNLTNTAAIMEPGISQNEPVDFYQLYPDLINIDATDPCTLSDFFASECEKQQEATTNQAREQMVPSLSSTNTIDEF